MPSRTDTCFSRRTPGWGQVQRMAPAPRVRPGTEPRWIVAPRFRASSERLRYSISSYAGFRLALPLSNE